MVSIVTQNSTIMCTPLPPFLPERSFIRMVEFLMNTVESFRSMLEKMSFIEMYISLFFKLYRLNSAGETEISFIEQFSR